LHVYVDYNKEIKNVRILRKKLKEKINNEKIEENFLNILTDYVNDTFEKCIRKTNSLLEYLLPSETLIEVHRKILHKDNFSNDLDKLLYELYQENQLLNQLS